MALMNATTRRPRHHRLSRPTSWRVPVLARVGLIVTYDRRVARENRLRLWAEHPECQIEDVSDDAVRGFAISCGV